MAMHCDMLLVLLIKLSSKPMISNVQTQTAAHVTNNPTGSILLFESGKTAVQPKGIDALKNLAKVLEQNPDINILVEEQEPVNTR